MRLDIDAAAAAPLRARKVAPGPRTVTRAEFVRRLVEDRALRLLLEPPPRTGRAGGAARG
jgi:hypothetical protein